MAKYHIKSILKDVVIVEADSEEEALEKAINTSNRVTIVNSRTVVTKVSDDYKLDDMWKF